MPIIRTHAASNIVSSKMRTVGTRRNPPLATTDQSARISQLLLFLVPPSDKRLTRVETVVHSA